MSGVKPIIYNTFEVNNITDNPVIATPYAYSDYVLAIVGIHSSSGSTIRGLEVLPVRNGNNWEIHAGLSNATETIWRLVVLAIRREFIDEQGYFS